jgi:hypothetical protein
MTVTYVAERALKTTSTPSALYTEVIPIASNCTANNSLVLVHSCYHNDVTGISVADSKGNSWTIDAGPSNTNNFLTFIASSRLGSTPLQSTDTVTITYNTAPIGGRSSKIEEFSNLGSGDTQAATSATASVALQNTGNLIPSEPNDTIVASFVTYGSPTPTYTLNTSGTTGTYSRFSSADQSLSGTHPIYTMAMYQTSASGTSGQRGYVTLSPAEGFQAVTACYFGDNVQVSSSDSFVGADAIAKQVIAVSETGSGLEGIQGRSLSVQETITGVDTASSYSTQPSVADTVSGLDVAKVAQIAVDVSNAATESSKVLIVATDSGTGVEGTSMFSGTTTPVVSQMSSFTEAFTLKVKATVADAFNGADGGETVVITTVPQIGLTTMAPCLPSWMPQDLGGLQLIGNPLNPYSMEAPGIDNGIPCDISGLSTVNSFTLGLVGSLPSLIPCDLGGLQNITVVPPGSDGWEVRVKAGNELGQFQTLLAVISSYETLSFSVELSDKGTGTITLDLDSPLFSNPLADGSPPAALLNDDNLWQVYRDEVLIFEFLGETTVETLVDPSEARPVTISGSGSIQTLTWARTLPPGYGTPGYVPKLCTLVDTLIAPGPLNVPEQDLWNECVGAGTNVVVATPAGGISFVQELAYQSSQASSFLTETITTHATATAGHTVILVHGTGIAAADIPGIGIVDSLGNTWEIDAAGSDANQDLSFIASTKMDVGVLTAGSTITIQYPIAPYSGRATWIEEFAGVGLADKSTSAYSNAETSNLNAGQLFPAVEFELIVAAFTSPGGSTPGHYGNYSFNAPGTVGTYSNFPSPTALVGLGSTPSPKLVTAGYQTGASPSAQVCEVTPVTPRPYQGVMAAYQPNPGVLSEGGPVIITGINDVTKPFPTLGAGIYDATYSSVYAAITPAPPGNGTTCTLFTLFTDSKNYVQFQIGQAEWSSATEYYQNTQPGWAFSCVMCSNGVISSYGTANGAAAYITPQMQYLRIRESSGIVFWDTSPDGASWTEYYQLSHTFPMNRVHVRFQVASTSAETVAPVSYVSSINLGATAYADIHTFTNVPQMAMFYELVQEAQTNRNVIPFVQQTYTPYEDSVGSSWFDSMTLAQGNGVDFYSLLQQYAGAIDAEYIMLPGFNLVICNTNNYGTDLSSTVIFFEGGQQSTKQRTRIRDSISNVFYVEDTVGRISSSIDSTSQSSYMIREGYLSAQGVMVPSSMQVLANAGIEQVSTPITSWVLTVEPDTVGRRVFEDYNVGDWIGVEDYSTGTIVSLRVMSIAIAVDNAQTVTCELTLNTRIQAFDELLLALTTKLNGNQTSGTSFASVTHALEGAAGAQSGVILPGGGVMSSLPTAKPSTKFSATISPGPTYITHNLGTYDISVQVWTAASTGTVSLVPPIAYGGALNYLVQSVTVNEILISLASIGVCRVVITGGAP